MQTPDGGSGSGYQVDPASLAGVAGQIGQAYDDYNTVIVDYLGSACYSEGIFGDPGVGQAWTAFNSAWGDELSVTSEALGEAAQKISAALQQYQSAEHAITGALGKVRAS
ncbi:MAG TPA: hypothetical protein VGX23_32295 [Actinocrinis sp.]|nr:hypothetical protein [Actinocrinis sp.]